MAKGRTTYEFTVKDPKKAEQHIEVWLREHKFKSSKLGNEEIYLSKSFWTGNKYFNYDITDNKVTLEAWCHGLAGDFDLDTPSSQSTARPFRSILDDILSALDENK